METGKPCECLGKQETNNNSSEIDASASVFSRISKSATAREAGSSAALSSVISSVSSRASQSASRAAKLGIVTETPKVSKKEERDQILSLLASWKTKFASSAEDSFANLKQEINDISSKALASKEKTEHKQVLDLKAQTDKHLAGLRHDIEKIIHSLTENPSEKEKSAAEARITTAIRATGEKIRDETAAVRESAREFENKLYDDVSEATQKHLGALDSTHDFGLQEIGMKWTGMNYVTQKDWKHFNDLRTEGKKTREKMIESARTNEKLNALHDWISTSWIGGATEVAKSAAAELQAIRSSSKKQLADLESPDDLIPCAQAVLKDAQHAVTPEEPIRDTIHDAAQHAKEAVFGTSSSTPVVESFASKISEQIYGTAPSLQEQVSETLSASVEKVKRVPGGVYAGFVANAEQIVFDDEPLEIQSRLAEASKAVADAVKAAAGYPTEEPGYAEKADQALSKASEILYGTPAGKGEQAFSIATDKYSHAVAAASSILYGTPTPVTEAAFKSASSVYEAAKASAASASAEAVKKGKKGSKEAEGLAAKAKASYDAALKSADESYSSALSSASILVYGTSTPKYEAAMSSASASLESAKSAASSASVEAIKNVKKGSAEAEGYFTKAKASYDAAIAAADAKYSEAVASASSVVYGTPTPVLEAAVSSASASLTAASASAVKARDEAYAKMKGHKDEKTLKIKAKENYESALKAAADAYSTATSSASSLVYGPPTPTLESILSQASSAYLSAKSSAASAREEAILKVKGQEKEKSIKDSLLSSYTAAISAADASYSSLSSSGQAAKKSYSSAVKEASKSYSSATSAASIKISGTPQPYAESLLSVANAKYTSAISAANSNYNAWASSALSTPTTPVYAQATDLLAAQASEASRLASEFLFGTPTPTASGVSASAAAASEAIQKRYADLHAVFAELIAGKGEQEQSYTESIQSRFNLALYGATTSLPPWAAATSAAGQHLSAASEAVAGAMPSMPPAVSALVEQYRSKIRELVYGPELTQREKLLLQIQETREAAMLKIRKAVYGEEAVREKTGVEKVQQYAKEEMAYLESLVEAARKRIEGAAAEAEAALGRLGDGVREKVEQIAGEARRVGKIAAGEGGKVAAAAGIAGARVRDEL